MIDLTDAANNPEIVIDSINGTTININWFIPIMSDARAIILNAPGTEIFLNKMIKYDTIILDEDIKIEYNAGDMKIPDNMPMIIAAINIFPIKKSINPGIIDNIMKSNIYVNNFFIFIITHPALILS